MSITPFTLINLNPESDRVYYKTYVTRPLPNIDNYNHNYPEPDYRFDPYWYIHLYNQHTLCFHQSFDSEIEPDCHGIDEALNRALSTALGDPWQVSRASVHLPA